MATGQHPFGGTSWHLAHQQTNEQPTPLTTLRPDTPPELENLVTQLLSKDPAERPKSAGQDEIYERHFGEEPPVQGHNVTSEITLTRSEAADGAVLPLRMTAHKPCPACASRVSGTGSAGYAPCEGSGQIKEVRVQRVRIPRRRPSRTATADEGDGGARQERGRTGESLGTVHRVCTTPAEPPDSPAYDGA
nr:hypothetical protein [Streptomyces alboflavus]